MTHIKSIIAQKIDKTSDEIFQTIQSLVRIPSVVGNEGKAQEWMVNLYNSLGLHAEKVVPKKVKSTT